MDSLTGSCHACFNPPDSNQLHRSRSDVSPAHKILMTLILEKRSAESKLPTTDFTKPCEQS